MQITPLTWQAPGNVSAVAPNMFQVVNQTLGTNWQMHAIAEDSGNNPVVVASWTLYLWDVTTNSSAFNIVGTNASIININANMNSLHTYAYGVSFTSGSCDHVAVSTTSIGASGWKNYPVAFVRRSGAWVDIGGPGVFVRRGGAWVHPDIVQTRRSGVWTSV